MRRTADVQRARRDGASSGNRMFVLNAIRSAEASSRLAVSAPMPLGGAVRRNRARRRARAAFQPLLRELGAATDLVVTVRAAALDAPFAELVRSARALLAELGLLRAAE